MNCSEWQIIGFNDGQKRKVLPEWFEAAAYAAAFVLIVFLFLMRVVLVLGPSMQPTLESNDRILVQSFFYTPQNYDVVVVDGYTPYGKLLVKRVIGKQGDEINIDKENGTIFLNGEMLTEPYIAGNTYRTADIEYPLTVPKGMVFVMGDNREQSLDSRSNEIGFLDERDILGKVIACVYPFDNAGEIK